MIKKFNSKIMKYKDDDKLTAKFLSSLSTKKYFNQALDAGCKVLIVDKNNNLVEFDKTRNKKIISKLEHSDYTLSEIKSIMNKKTSKYIIKSQ